MQLRGFAVSRCEWYKPPLKTDVFRTTGAGLEMRPVAAVLFALPFAATLCPQGAVQGTRPDDCYLYGDAESWQEAQQYCALSRGHLSSVPNAFVNAFLISYPKAFSSAQPYWLGAERKNATAKWAWTDGSNFTYTQWARGKRDYVAGVWTRDRTCLKRVSKPIMPRASRPPRLRTRRKGVGRHRTQNGPCVQCRS